MESSFTRLFTPGIKSGIATINMLSVPDLDRYTVEAINTITYYLYKMQFWLRTADILDNLTNTGINKSTRSIYFLKTTDSYSNISLTSFHWWLGTGKVGFDNPSTNYCLFNQNYLFNVWNPIKFITDAVASKTTTPFSFLNYWLYKIKDISVNYISKITYQRTKPSRAFDIHYSSSPPIEILVPLPKSSLCFQI